MSETVCLAMSGVLLFLLRWARNIFLFSLTAVLRMASAVHVLLGGNELAHHLLFVVGDALQADVEVDLRRCCGASDVQYAVDLRRFATEARAVIEFAKRHAVDGVHGSQGQRSLLGIAGKGDAAAGCEGEVGRWIHLQQMRRSRLLADV